VRKTELFNDLSKELVDSTKLKPGESVRYRLYDLPPHPMDPSKKAIPAIRQVPVMDQIYDPSKDEYVDIAAVRSVDAKGEHTYYDLSFSIASAGEMVLVGGRAADQEIHSYLSLCNYNVANPNRDPNKEAIFELVDEKAKSEVERKTRNIKREALNAAADLTADDVRNYTAALGRDDSGNLEVLRNHLEDLADKSPADFLELIGNKQALMKATINRALSKGVILFNEEQSRFSWPNGEAILTVARTTGGDNIEELISFCVSSAKGEKVYQTIQSKAKSK
jgi:hypothetical protein